MRSQYAHFRGLEIALLAQSIDPPRGSSSSRGRVVRVVGSVGWALFISNRSLGTSDVGF